MLHIIQAQLRFNKERFEGILKNMNAINPLAILERGYSICSKNEKSLKNTEGIDPGDKVQVRLSRGGLDCTVKKNNRGKLRRILLQVFYRQNADNFLVPGNCQMANGFFPQQFSGGIKGLLASIDIIGCDITSATRIDSALRFFIRTRVIKSVLVMIPIKFSLLVARSDPIPLA